MHRSVVELFCESLHKIHKTARYILYTQVSLLTFCYLTG